MHIFSLSLIFSLALYMNAQYVQICTECYLFASAAAGIYRLCTYPLTIRQERISLIGYGFLGISNHTHVVNLTHIGSVSLGYCALLWIMAFAFRITRCFLEMFTASPLITNWGLYSQGCLFLGVFSPCVMGHTITALRTDAPSEPLASSTTFRTTIGFILTSHLLLRKWRESTKRIEIFRSRVAIIMCLYFKTIYMNFL